MLKRKSNLNVYGFEESRGLPTFVFTGEGSFHITDSLSDERRLVCHFCPGPGLPTSSRGMADVSWNEQLAAQQHNSFADSRI